MLLYVYMKIFKQPIGVLGTALRDGDTAPDYFPM